jgi:hypothetical protein
MDFNSVFFHCSRRSPFSRLFIPQLLFGCKTPPPFSALFILFRTVNEAFQRLSAADMFRKHRQRTSRKQFERTLAEPIESFLHEINQLIV